MRVLHIFDHSLPLHSGYSFRSADILRHQRRLGLDTHHLTSPRHVLAGPLVEEVEGLEFHRTPAPPPGWSMLPGMGELALMRATTRRLRELVARIRPDVLHAHSPVLNAIPALYVGRRTKTPVLYEVRANWEDAAITLGKGRSGDVRYRLSRLIETYALRRVDAITTICEGLRQEITARGIPGQKITVIPNAVNIAEFPFGGSTDTALAAELGLADKRVLGFIGSFYSYEGLHYLIEALPEILARNPETGVLLVGGGPEEENLKRLAAERDVEDRIAFTGRIPHDQIHRYYDLVEIFIYPRASNRLTDLVTPLKPLEAMARGKVVVASDVGGHRELIRDGDTGTLFAPNDPEALAEAVSRVLAATDRWSDQLRRAREFVEKERDWADVVRRYLPVYERLAGVCATGPKS